MKCRRLCLQRGPNAAHSLYLFEKRRSTPRPSRIRVGDPTRSIAGLPTAHFSDYWHVRACDSRKRLISGCRTSPRMVLSFEILNSARADWFRFIRRHKLPWSVICRSDASLPHSTITCSLVWENRSCFGTMPTWHFAEPSRRSAFRVIRAFRGPRSMRCDTPLQ